MRTSKRSGDDSTHMIRKTLLLTQISLLLASPSVLAATSLLCSATQSGKAVINEIQTQNNFIEIYLKSSADIKNWTLYQDGTKIATLGSGTCKVNATSAGDNTSNGTTTTTWPAGTFIVCDQSINPSKGEILLVDKSGTLAANNTSVIDYIAYGKLTGKDVPVWTTPSSCGTLLPDHDADQKDIARVPDGTGALADNGKKNDTKGKSNSGSTSGSVDHYEIDLPATGLTCQNSNLTVRACSSAAAPCTGNLSSTTTTVSLTASSGSFASSTLTFTGSGNFSLSNTSPATVTVSMSSPALTPTCFSFDGTTRTPLGACAFEVKKAAFLFNIPDFSAGDGSGNVIISAVRQDDTTKKCVSFVPNGSVKVWTNYLDPASGTKSATLSYAGNSYTLPTSTPSVGNLPWVFDTNGEATFSLNYLDAGQLRLNAEWNSISGQSDFVVKPYFAVSGITCADGTTNPGATGPTGSAFCRAGQSFSATVKAVTNDGVTSTPNFGRESTPESVRLTALLVSPSGGNTPSLAGALTKTTDPSIASSSTLSWPEVGVISLSPGIADGSYLGAGDILPGSMPKVGRFYPDHFDTSIVKVGNVPMDCPGTSASFTCPTSYNGLVYAGQPFSVRVTAKSLGGDTTANYSGSSGFARAIELAVRTTPGGSLSPSGAASGNLVSGSSTAVASTFSNGVSTLSSVAYAYATPPGNATDIYFRASETAGSDNVTSLRSVAATSAEAGIKVAQGRIRLANAFGTGRNTLDINIEAQLWTGSNWTPNPKDATALTIGAVAVGSGLTANSLSFTNGKGFIRLAAPTAAGSYDIGINLGTTGSSLQTCTTGLTGGTATNTPWMRSRHGACTSSYDRDPSARATFGIYPPETEKHIHVRELY